VTEFDLNEIGTERVSIYLVLPVDRLDTHGRWLRLMLTLIIGTIARLPQPPPWPVLFIVDEMGTIGRLNALARAYGLLAGMGVRVWGFLQDLNQLSRDYSDGWQTFIANTDSIQLLTATDLNTAEYFSKMAGVRTVERISVDTAKAREGGLWRKGDPNYSAMADQLSQRPVLYPDEISRRPEDRLLIFPRGDFVINAQRIIYHTDKRFAGHFRYPPQFAPPGFYAPPAKPKKPFVGKITTDQLATEALESLGWSISRPTLLGGSNWTITNKAGASQKIKKADFIKIATEMTAYKIRGD
jgi:type IV secretory pathway TraG/TraD family ATPase VirD4